MERVAILASGGFKKLPAHAGAYQAYYDHFVREKVPKPYLVTGSSAGAIISTAACPWTKRNLEVATQAVLHLKKGEVFRPWRLAEVLVLLTLGEDFMNFLPWGQKSRDLSPHYRTSIEIAKSVLSFSTKAALVYDLLEHQPSLFSSAPLKKLLQDKERGINFKGVWESDIKLEIPAVDLQSGEMVYFTNYLEGDRQLANRDEMLIKMIMASASIVAFLPTIEIGGRWLDDAAILDNLNIVRALHHQCNVIFLLLHNRGKEPYPINSRGPTWIEELTRALDISIGQSTRLDLDRHQSINHNLRIHARNKKVLRRMKELSFCSDHCLNAQEELGELISELENSPWDFADKHRTRIIPVYAPQPLEELTFRQFGPKQMERNWHLGYTGMEQALANFLREAKEDRA